jgi:hypothetical protein
MSVRDDSIKQIRKKYEALKSVFDEHSRRQWAAIEAEQYGRGGLAWVCEATGMSHNTVKKGAIEIAARENEKDTGMENKRIRREGGGRKKLTDKNANLADDLKRPCRARDTRRPHVAFTLDKQKHLCVTFSNCAASQAVPG